MTAWQQVAGASTIGALCFVPVAAAFDFFFAVKDDDEDVTTSLGWVLWEELTGVAGPVVLVWVVLNLSRMISIDTGDARVLTAVAASKGPIENQVVPEFWKRTPKEIGTDLVALSAELHYLRVHTTNGEALILYPFGRAVQELAASGLGLQVHRSHWVAINHVTEVKREGQAARCAMATGLLLPVSRRRRAALEAAVEDGQKDLTSKT